MTGVQTCALPIYLNQINKPPHHDPGTNQSTIKKECEKEDREREGEFEKENDSDESESKSEERELKTLKNYNILLQCALKNESSL